MFVSSHETRGMHSGWVTRRSLLRWLGLASAGVALAACSAPASSPAPAPAAPAAQAATPATSAAAAPTAPASATQAPLRPEKRQVRYAIVPGMYDSIFFRLTEHKGFFREVGLDVEIIDVPSGDIMQKGVLAGEIDVALLGNSNVVIPNSQGADLRFIAAPAPKSNYLLYTKRDDIQGPLDLVGKSIGVAGQNSTLHILMLDLLTKYQISPSQVQFVNIGAAAEVAKAVFAGKVDAGPAGVDQQREAMQVPGVRVVANLAAELPNFVRALHGALGSAVRERNDMMTAFLVALSKGIRYGLDNREETLDFGVELLGRDRETLAIAFDWYIENQIMNPNLGIEKEKLEAMQESLVAVGLIPAVLPAEQISDFSAQQRMLEILGPYQPKA